MSTKQRLLFITTGGTIASVRTQQGLKPVLTSEELLAHLPELNDLCCPDTLALCSIDSTDLGPEHWLMMAKAVQENYALYDGFIICHGTDTLAYSAAALSYLIQNADKPIILTGAQQPISNEITDAKKNLRDSVICALDPGSRGVMVVFGGHVIAGTRAKKNKTISYDAFASVNFPALALVQGDRLVRYVPSPWPTGPVEFGRALSPRVFLLKLTPGLRPALIPDIFRLYDCVIVESFGVGGIPQRLMDAFAEGLGDYDKTRKVLILTTQVTYEGSDVGIYEVGKRVKNRFRFLEAHDMTIEAVVTKIMWLLAQDCDSFDQLQQRFYRQVNFDTFYHEKIKNRAGLTSTTTFSEYHLHQQHIAQRASCDGDERLMLPLMERDGHADGDGLGDAVAACGKTDALEAVDDEHPEDGGGQHMAQIFHHLGHPAAPGAEHQKRQKPGEHGRRRTDGDGQDELEITHRAASLSLASMGRRSRSRAARMQTIEGMRKLPAPKMRRQTSGAARPMTALACCFSFSHWLRKMTTNMAVMTKSTPSVLKGRTAPRAAPMAALATQ